MSKDKHLPVLLSHVIEMLSPSLLDKKNPTYFDGTFGRGGHLRALLEQFPSVQATAFDQDLQAIQYAQEKFKSEIAAKKLNLFHKNFSEFSSSEFGLFDAMLLDLGVSSPQLDQAERGFSFYNDGPLDMRMNQTFGKSAAEIIANLSEEELLSIFQELGEVPKPHRVVQAIIHDRKQQPFQTTRQLASLIERVDGWRRKGFHPATQYFMALRLYVNNELEVVKSAIVPLILGLKPRGRLAVLTFHSLEDRIVKNLFREKSELGQPVNKKVIQATWSEQKENPRSRSAKLRVFERGEH